MRRLITCSLTLALAVACGEPQALPWRVELGSSLSGESVVYVEGRIFRGGCDGGLWYEAGQLVGSGTTLPVPEALDDGTWGFAGRAANDRCEWFASGCVERRIPEELSPVVVTIERGEPPFTARCADCDAGICRSDPLPPPRLVSPAPGGYFFGGVGVPVTPTFRFEPSRGATRHVVEVSAVCGDLPTVECDFGTLSATLEVSGTATEATLDGPLPTPGGLPVGARYAVRIRACDTTKCSASPARVFHVGRQATDMNGDGLGDAVVGAPGEGAVYALFGDRSLESVRLLEVPGSPLPTRGAAVAMGDVTGDGYADLLVGAPFAGTAPMDRGFVDLYLGTADGPQNALVVPHPDPMTASTFGSALAILGDVDGDGYDDFAIGAPQHDREGGDVGTVFVFFGARNLAGTLRSVQVPAPAGLGDGRFGESITGGDLDGDGFADLVVGAPRAAVGALMDAGRVFVHRGPSLDGSAGIEVDAEPVSGARFGAGLAIVGDIDRDGRADLVVGGPGANGGRAYVYLGSPMGLAPGRVEIVNTGSTMAAFGARAAGLGDVNGDDVPDFAIAATAHQGSGGVFVYSGADIGP
ncbi:MAG: VCBS repeat-containing protein, partial [Deltaproteobacteria bacterium]|nr:VCBS repeat-containing protein [Deltaproteobacteria bacterium]